MYKTIDLRSLNAGRHMTEEEIADEQRIIEASKKEPQVFGRLYDRYYEGIFHFVYRRTDDEELTADLCSQTFLKALQNLKKYEFRGLPFSAWLFRIASNEVNKFYNKKKKNRVFSIEEERVLELFETDEKEFSQEQVQLLIKTLKELPTETIEVLELRFFEDRSFKEIAFILNIGESGAKMRLYRAVEKLKEHFKVNWNE
ncbi:RNA polymerase, sigma-E factor [Fulvivirga imtechensis AK7]|uniref:RNA polymerase, sigma-E factor n=1 Tax=Fulvivirga imtechensis AK7 TaxID=1237149 RepID=L8JZS3_9BACT|nr:sigma-70 family RNA polymerase sigma factor [Fulvivirga imtechensis]ELR73648.1 RNA polymerase, sigma-E factor [Fulvivirga imtechensis AK7]